MIIKEKNILPDDSFGELASDKTKSIHKEKPHEYS
jgi:hypothetical protein